MQKLIRLLLHPRDSVFNLVRLLDASPFYSKIPDLRDLAIMLPDRYASSMREELSYVESVTTEELVKYPFPYPRVRNGSDAYGGYDDEKKLPYVIHKGKRVYFPAPLTVELALAQYLLLRDIEGITGEGCLLKSPHCYQSPEFKVESGDVVLDIGCAEALFALDRIDLAHEIRIFEFDSQWFKPLQATFSPFGEKVKFFPKFVGAKTDGDVICLADAVSKNKRNTFFIKMDIEGGERDVIDSSRDFLRNNRVKLACCVYHRQDDEQYICSRLREYGYHYTFSEGYMLPICNGIHAPYFRHGVVYATNID